MKNTAVEILSEDVPVAEPAANASQVESARLLLVDDDPLCQSLCERYLARANSFHYEVCAESSGEAALNRIATEQFDCLLIDYYLPDLTGTQLLRRLQESDNGEIPPAIILTANGGEKAAISAVRSGATDFLPKRALSVTSLERAVGNAIANYRLRQSVAQRRSELRIANKELRQRTEEINRFYNSVSHEVKTPLAAVREFVALVRDGVVGPVVGEQIELLDHALDGCDQIAGHFNALVEMTRLEANKVSLKREIASMRSLSKQCVAGVAKGSFQQAHRSHYKGASRIGGCVY